MAARLVAVRGAILTAAATQVAAGGWSELTIARVAEDAGVAVGTVYRHIADKDALCVEVFERTARRELDAVRQASAAEVRPLAALAAGLHTFAQRALQSPRLAYALLAEPATPAVEQQRLAFRQSYRRLFENVIDDGMEAGEIGPCDPTTAAAVIVGAMSEGLVGPLAPARGAPSDEHGRIAREILGFCLRALPQPAT